MDLVESEVDVLDLVGGFPLLELQEPVVGKVHLLGLDAFGVDEGRDFRQFLCKLAAEGLLLLSLNYLSHI